MKKNKKYLRLLLLSLFTVITLLTCKPSLGGQVDILPPKGVITYPPTGENPIRGSFIIKGTASDDEEVTSVSVVFTNKETKATTRSFSGKLIPTGGGGVNWEIEINNDTDVYKDSRGLIKDYPIPDGEYEAKITITDKQGKPAFLDKTYKIDNTPPVFIASRPSTLDTGVSGQLSEAYGSKLRIVGEAGDIHSLEKIGFSFPDEYASIKKIVKGNKESSVNIVMAEHENPETGSDYAALQAVQGNPVVNPVKGKLILSDDARVYDGSSTASEDFPGNRSEFYYIKNNIEKDVLSKGYTAKVIHDYFAGKKGNASGSEHEKLIDKLSKDNDALDALKEKRIFVSGENNTVKYTTFNLDPNKTPGFKIIGSSVVSSDISSVSGIPKVVYAQGSNLTVELYQNKDKISLLSNNTFQGIKDKKIKIVLYKGKGNTEEEQLASLKADNYTTNPEITKVVLFNASGDGDGPADVQFDPTNTEHQKGITIGEIIKIERQLPNGFRSGVYRIDITGKDAAGNDGFDPMLSDTERTGYASIIKFELSAQAPVIYTEPIEKYQKDNVTFTVKADVENLDSTNGKVYYWLDNNSLTPQEISPLSATATVKKYEIGINTGANEGRHTITIKAEDSETGKSALRELSFIVDKTKPAERVLTQPATGIAEFSEWSYTFKGTVSDEPISSVLGNTKGSGISKVTWMTNKDTTEPGTPSEALAKLTAPSGSETAYKWEANIYFNHETENYVHLWFYDGVGNITYKREGPYKVNSSAPLIEDVRVKMKDIPAYNHDLKADTTVVLGKGNKNQVKLEIKAKTQVEGRKIESVEVTVNGVKLADNKITKPSPIPASNISGTWIADLSSLSELTTWDTNNEVKKIKIIVKDGPAPHRITTLDGSFILDKEDPSVSFTSPRLDSNNSYTASNINKTITISGSISDTKAAKSIKIVKDDTGNTALTGVIGNTEFTVPDAYNWSFKLDTTAYTDNADLKLKAIVEDKAGNKTERPFTLKINQDADRPVIRVNSFTNIASASLTGSRTLSGTVTDDDGSVDLTNLKIKVGNGVYESVTSLSGGSIWTYEIPSGIADGDITLNFTVTDAAGTEFNNGIIGNSLKRPKVIGAKDEITAAKDKNITFKLDTHKPSFKAQAHSFVLGSSFPSGNNGTLFGANAVIGNKNSKTASFRVWVKDDIADGIASVSLSIGSGAVQNGTANPSANDGDYEAWDITNVTLPDSAEGNPDIKIIATDKSGFTNEISVPVIIDFTAPAIEHQSPVLDGIYFNEINLSGLIGDTAPGNGRASGVKTETIVFKIGEKDDTNYSYGTAHNHGSEEFSSLVRTASSWTVKIPDISKYKGLTSVIGPSGSSSIHILPITIKGEDNAGNVSEEKTYKIKFDPNGGTPTLAVVSPKKVMKAGVETGESIGGDVVISGSASVANPASGKFVTEITLQLRKDGQSFGTSWMLDGKDYGSGHVIAANSTGIQYWNHVLTQAVRNGIFAPLPSSTKSVAVYLRVKGKNNVGTDGDWSAERKFILSKDVAEFYEIKLNGENYAPNGKWIKGNGFNITGKVKHNSGIKNDLHAASESVPAGVQSLNTSGTTNGFNPSPTAITDGSDSGYSFTVPIKTNGYEQKSGYIEFDITATDGRTQDYQTVKSKIMLKYDNSKPAAVFGRAAGKFNKAAFTDSAASGVLVNLEGTETVQQAVDRLKKNLENLVLFAETKNGSAKAVKVTNLTAQGSYARAEFASTADFASSAACILLEQNPIVFDRTSTNYQLQGFAYDTGSKTKTIKIEFGSTDTGSITRFDPESGNFVSFTHAVQTNTLDDGKHILKLTPADDAGNTGDVYSCDVFVRNKPLKITNVSFSTDLNGNNNYSNDTTSGLVETVTKAGDGSLDSVQNYSQTLDITKEFTLKKADKSQIKFALEGGQGTTRNFTLYKVAATSADPWALDTAVKSGSLTAGAIDFVPSDFAAGQISDGDNRKFVIVLTDGAVGDPGRKLTLNVTLNVKTNDTRKPSVFISPFYWNAEDDNSLASNDRTKGHIEIKKVSTGAGESDVSGTVVLRGTSYHPTKLTALELTVDTAVKTATYASGAWSSSDSLTVKDIRLDVNGHWVEWEYTWTTSDVGKKDISIKAYHNAVESGTSNAGTVTRKTAVTRSSNQSLQLASGDTAVPGQVLRIVDTVSSGTTTVDGDVSYLVTITSVEGDVVKWEHITVPARFTDYYLYPVGYAGDEPSFNKPAMSVNVVPYVTGIKTALSKLGGTNDPDLYARTATGRYPVQDKEKIEIQGFNLSGAAVTVGGVSSGTLSGTASPWSLTLDAGAKSGALDLTVTPSGGSAVKVINNLTDNEKPYNKAKKTASNDKLTDDLFLDVWQFNDKAARPHRGVITEPVMHINPSNGMIGFAFANGPDFFSMSNGTGNSYERWQRNYDDYGNVDFIYDSEGNSHGVVVGRDINSGGNQGGKFTYFSSKWGISSITNQAANYDDTKGRRLEAIGQIGDMNGAGGTILDKTRIQHPSLAAVIASDAGKPRIYLAYYDGINDQIRFKYGTNDKAAAADFGQFKDQETTRAVTPYNQDNVGIVAGKYKNGSAVVNTGNATGTYLSLGVVSGTTAATDTAVLIWFDETNRKLKYTYKTDPQNGSHASQSGNGNGTWSVPIDVFNKMNVGEYCKIVVDKAGGIHIAAFDSDSADLKYAYLSSYNASSFQTATVDSYGITGTHITLDVAYTAAGAAGKPVPYIGYYSASAGRSKLAYLVDTATGVSGSAQGTDSNGYFTGKWEVSVVPTASRVQQDNINVGVWKGNTATDYGVIKNSVTGANTSGTESGTVHGNGTANPVLGYAIRQAMNGYIETAQKK
ncbi:hypothetical protein E4O05_12335 [Treponema sp. OMZ 787]|uniref:hypothetical protein n=1 Tax=Treponema sp. OMZ 787 TaxID=2563669 RepID=UPI0020A5A095|nr:hypothetical protein [Treponema sp. OMZ 787]UTC62276.1 hypothetical protein E4O05_12335 [Treponema sp. OMZ 787]